MDINRGNFDVKPNNRDEIPKLYKETRKAYLKLLFGYSIALMIPSTLYACLLATFCWLGQSRVRFYANNTAYLVVFLSMLLFVILFIFDNEYEREGFHFTGTNESDILISCLYYLIGPLCTFL